MPDVVALYKGHSNRRQLHLYLPGYIAARSHGPTAGRRRERDDQSLCAGAWAATESTNYRGETRPTGVTHLSLVDATALIAEGFHEWCPLCVGRLAALDRSTQTIIDARITRQETPHA